MRHLLIFLSLFIFTFAEETDVDIKANNFSADKAKNLIIFTGKVSMIKGKDTVYCEKLTVYTKEDKTTNKTVIQNYIAVGNVDMKIHRPTTIMIAKGNTITYDVDEQIYVITGNGYLEDTVEQRVIKGEKIHYNAKNENTNIDGGKNKPVQFKFKMESN